MSKRFRQHPAWVPYFWAAPFLIVFAVFLAYPMLLSVKMAFHQNAGPRVAEFVGTKNFSWMVQDPLFWTAVRNTAVFAAASVFIQLPASLGLALLLNSPKLKARGFWRAIFFAPVLVGLPFVAILAGLVFEKNTGLLNVALHTLTSLEYQLPSFLGGQTLSVPFTFDIEFPWLQNYVMWTLIIAAFWMYVGFNMVYFLAALQNVDKSQLEAAEIDGANAWHRFVNVTLPAIRPIASFVLLLSLIGSFQLFELPYLLLNETAGPNNQGLTLVMYLYQQGFDRGDLGYASAVGWVLAIALFAFAVAQQFYGRLRGSDV
ncbi:sugar ABC transporter permease [Phycisphaeraceae bacterium D3-23]